MEENKPNEQIEDTPKMYTQEDVDKLLTKEVTKEVDRRVESGIQKGLETYKSKWEAEYERKAKLTAEELAQEQIQAHAAELAEKERGIARRANRIEAKETLSSAGIPKAHYEGFLDMLVADDENITSTNVTNFIEMFNSTKTELETALRAEMTSVKAPKQETKDKALSRAEFNKLPYSEKMKLKAEQPDVWKKFMN